MTKAELDKVASDIATTLETSNSFVLNTVKQYLPLYLKGFITNDELITQLTVACLAVTKGSVIFSLSSGSSNEKLLVSSSDYSRGSFVIPQKDNSTES